MIGSSGSGKGLEIIAGRSGSGKTYELFERIRRIERAGDYNGGNSYLIVPDQATVIYEDALIEHVGGSGLLNTEIMSFSRLIERIIENTGLRGRIPVDGVGKVVLLGKVMRELRASEEFFGKGSSSPGFLSKLTELITELEMSGYDSDKLLESIGEISDEALKFKIAEIQKVYEAYEKVTEGIYLDVEKQAEFAASVICSHEDYRSANIFIDGFYTYSSPEIKIIESFLINAGKVTVTALIDSQLLASTHEYIHSANIHSDGHIFEPIENSISRFKRFTLENGLDFEVTKACYEGSVKPPELLHLEKNLFAWPPTIFEGELSSIVIEKCKSVFDEVERAATSISKKIRDKGANYRDIGVICGDGEIYPPIIKRIFKDYDLPVFIDEKRPIKYYPIVKAITSVLETVSSGFGNEGIYRLMKSGMFDLKRNDLEKLEIYSKEKGFKYGKWFKKIEDDEGLEETRAWLVDPIVALSKKLKGEKNAANISLALVDYLEEMSFPGIINRKIRELSEKGEVEIASEYAQSWNGAMAVIDQLTQVCTDYEVDLMEYAGMIKDGFGAKTAGILPSSFDSITVGDVQRSVFDKVKHLYILGFNDGSIPSACKIVGLISSGEKEILKKHGIKLSTELGEISMLENLKIYSLLTKPTESLSLSYTISKLEGESGAASLILERLFLSESRIFKKAKVMAFDMGGVEEKVHINMVNAPISTIKRINSLKDGECKGLKNAILRSVEEIDGMDIKLRAISQGREHYNDFKAIDKALSKVAFPSGMSVSVSRLEKYNKCPFAHLVAYGLRPGEEKDYEVRGDELGNIYHGVLEDAFRLLKEKGSLDEEGIDEIVEVQIEKLASTGRISGIFTETGVGRYATKRIKSRVSESAKALILQLESGSFEPYLLEADFGNERHGVVPKLKPVYVDCGDKNAVIEGRIDRVDIARTKEGNVLARVIDYKSGDIDLNVNEVMEGWNLQLIHYLNSVVNSADTLGFDEIKPAGAYYFRVNEPVITSQTLMSGEELSNARTDKMSMKGITLYEEASLKATDKEYESSDRGYEIIENMKRELKKAGGEGSIKLLTEDKFLALTQIVREKTQSICSDLMDGYAPISPLRMGDKTGCDYCQYSSICQFEIGVCGNNERVAVAKTVEELLEILESKGKRGEEIV